MMTLKQLDRQRKDEVRDRIRAERDAKREAKAQVMQEELRIRAEWHVSNAEREIAYCERMLGRYTKRAEDLRYKVTYYQSIGLPCAGLEQQLVKAEDDLFKHEQRISKAELELSVWQHRINNIDVF